LKLMEKLFEMIDDEMEGAERYAKCAIAYKEEQPALAKAFLDISGVELGHANTLHNEAVKQIEENRKKHGAVSLEVKALYDFLHRQQIKRMHGVRMLHEEFKGN